MPQWCWKCKEKGHVSKDCTNVIENRRNDPNTYASRTAGYGGFKAATASTAAASDTPIDEDDFPPMDTLAGQQVIRKSSTNTNTNMNTSSSVTEIIPFFSQDPKFSFFSNLHQCSLTIDGQRYTSTEQYLIREKAKKVGDRMREQEVMASKTGADAKKIGRKTEWDEGRYGPWMEFGKEKLYKANKAKYEQNEELRKNLFETAPKNLVEANPNDTRWGVGLAYNDPAIYDQAKWKGNNEFGKLLTDLRDELMTSEEYLDEARQIMERKGQTDDHNPKKRRYLTGSPKARTDDEMDLTKM